ncbi:alpha/beta hydrolase [Aestuariimicrobium soli]|uniref:alpha/beta hydrolase n=1 Tax=Aestuariimicrobium soli TaxID=2035834 RepID=UPI003EB81323
MTAPDRCRSMAVLALVVALVAAGCSLVDRPHAGSAAGSSASSAAGSTSPRPATFAEFNPARHETWTRLTSPDRVVTSSDATPEGFVDPPAGRGLQRYADQRIEWFDCPEQGGVQCASVTVPLDWDEPDGQAITLAMARKRGQGQHRATLFVNPGGPGGSGMSMAAGFDLSPYPGHDVIGWDPRGSGRSTPVVCGTPAQTDGWNAVDPTPTTPRQVEQLRAVSRAFATQCRASSGALLDHISTIDTARDLDYLRWLVGDERLSYLGISYGTFIGATYAELYPQRVGRMVLDSAVNITDNESVIQAMGFDASLDDFAGWCQRQGECALGSTKAAVVQAVNRWIAGLDASPRTVNGHVFGSIAAATGIAAFMYAGEGGYRNLYNSLQWALLRDEPTYIAQAGDSMIGRNRDGSYSTMAYAFPAISCADWADAGVAGAQRRWAADRRLAPIFGQWFGMNLTCPVWTAAPAPQLRLTAKGSAPILVLGSTIDPATPYQQSVWMAGQLENAVLITRQGAGHSAYSLGGECVRAPVIAYLNDGTVPPATTCKG